jgi:hypothetical protein
MSEDSELSESAVCIDYNNFSVAPAGGKKEDSEGKYLPNGWGKKRDGL